MSLPTYFPAYRVVCSKISCPLRTSLPKASFGIESAAGGVNAGAASGEIAGAVLEAGVDGASDATGLAVTVNDTPHASATATTGAITDLIVFIERFPPPFLPRRPPPSAVRRNSRTPRSFAHRSRGWLYRPSRSEEHTSELQTLK